MLRRDEQVAVGDAIQVNIISGPAHTLQTACPEDAILWSHVVCSLETFDIYGNAAEYSFEQAQKNFYISTESANMSFTTVAKGVYKVKYYLSPVSAQPLLKEVVVSSISGNKNWTVMLRSTDINSIDVKCPTEVKAGGPLPCTISARNAAGILYGNESEAFGFSISILSSPSGNATDKSKSYVVRYVTTGTYQITPTISKTGVYNIKVSFKNKNISVVSNTFEVKYASISHTKSFSSCPQRSSYMSRVVCAVVLYDTYGNLYGKNLSAAVSHKLEISGIAILHGVVTYVSPGHYDVVYIPSITGSAVISTKYDEISLVTNEIRTIDIEPGAPISFSVDCPEFAILNSTYLCRLNASDRYGHLTSAGAISASNATMHSMRYTEVVEIAGTQHVGTYKLYLRTTEPGSYQVKLFSSNVANVTIIPTNISLDALDITCFNSTIFAGQTFSCEVAYNIGMQANLIEARGFTTVVNKISNGVTQASFSNFEAGHIAGLSDGYQIFADLREAGEYQISLFFANLALFQNKKVSVLPDEKVDMLLLDCPTEIIAGTTFLCNASTTDKYGNVGGNEEDLEALSVHAYDEESGVPYELTIQRKNWTGFGKYGISIKNSLYVGHKIIVRALFVAIDYVKTNSSITIVDVSEEPIKPKLQRNRSSLTNATSDEINATKTFYNTSSTTTVQPSTSCVSKDYLYNLCVKRRRKWGFTCQTASWKIGNICFSNSSGFVNKTTSGDITCMQLCT